ncbi:MAG TPA: DUF2510 domain-containing protein [Phycicoccus sp.]|nr:DUF2510 domain-containing protein [Phycicoccus sp.]
MSAPPGWHLQPDGRERWWDGQQWTDQFRAALPNDPTAPPAEPLAGGEPSDSALGGAPGEGLASAPPPWASDQTEALDVDRTQAIPAPPPGGYGAPVQPPSYPGQQDYSYPSGGGGLPPSSTGYPAGGYGAPGYGAPGYGAPGGQYPPPRQGMSGAAKGCLFAAIGIVVIVVIAVIAAVFFFARTANRISDEISSGIPTNLPSDFPSDLPSDFPSDLPSVGGQAVTVSVGDGFDLPRASIADGWSVSAGSFGSQVSGMKATFTEGQSVPVVFSMSFRDKGSGTIETVCTATPSSSTATTADVTCIPLFGDVDENGEVVVTPAF